MHLVASAADFRAWRARLGWSQAEAARQLGRSAAMVRLYERGERYDGAAVQIPRDIVLACYAIDCGAPRLAK